MVHWRIGLDGVELPHRGAMGVCRYRHWGTRIPTRRGGIREAEAGLWKAGCVETRTTGR